MRRIIGAVLSLAIVIICLTANADTYRKGQDPIAGYAAMYCSTMEACTLAACDTINAPENYKIAKFDIWALDTVTVVMNLKFLFRIEGDSTDMDVAMLSGAGVATEDHWYWQFPVSCERVIMTNKTAGADWAACVYLMRYGEGAGVTGKTHPWKRESAPQ